MPPELGEPGHRDIPPRTLSSPPQIGSTHEDLCIELMKQYVQRIQGSVLEAKAGSSGGGLTKFTELQPRDR